MKKSITTSKKLIKGPGVTSTNKQAAALLGEMKANNQDIAAFIERTYRRLAKIELDYAKARTKNNIVLLQAIKKHTNVK